MIAKFGSKFMGAALVAGMALSAGVASAATVTFSNFTSTNSSQLNPLVTVSEVSGGFNVSVKHTGTDDGHLNLIAFDLGTGPVTSSDITAVKNNSTTLTLQTSGCTGGGAAVTAGKYCFGTAVPLGGNSNNLNGLSNLPLFEAVLAFRNNDAIADATSTFSFIISSLGGNLKLSDFLGVGLRYQSSNNGSPQGNASDKLFATVDRVTPPPPPPIPLPASGLLLATGLAALAWKRRKA